MGVFFSFFFKEPTTTTVINQEDIDRLKDEHGNVSVVTKGHIIMDEVNTDGAISVQSKGIDVRGITSGGGISILSIGESCDPEKAKQIRDMLRQ